MTELSSLGRFLSKKAMSSPITFSYNFLLELRNSKSIQRDKWKPGNPMKKVGNPDKNKKNKKVRNSNKKQFLFGLST
jgi:hypothetical protein